MLYPYVLYTTGCSTTVHCKLGYYKSPCDSRIPNTNIFLKPVKHLNGQSSQTYRGGREWLSWPHGSHISWAFPTNAKYANIIHLIDLTDCFSRLSGSHRQFQSTVHISPTVSVDCPDLTESFSRLSGSYGQFCQLARPYRQFSLLA